MPSIRITGIWIVAAAVALMLPWIFPSGFALTVLSQMGVLIIFALAYTLKHRRLVAYSKVFREYRRDQNPQKTESEMDDLDVYLWLEQPDVQTADYYLHEEAAFNLKL